LPLLEEGPGLKPLDIIGFIQGAEAPYSLRRAKTGVIPQPVKPHWKKAACGGTKVPPFQNEDLFRDSLNPHLRIEMWGTRRIYSLQREFEVCHP
jgi:hypothetical protein